MKRPRHYSQINLQGLKFVDFGITEHANLNELDYRDKKQLSEDEFGSPDKFIKRYDDGRLDYADWVLSDVNPSGIVCELGAGACWLTSLLSTLSVIEAVYALEFSESILRNIAPTIISRLGGKKEKITLVRGDFLKTGFENNVFDYIFFDAALQSSPDYKMLFDELSRILKPKGIVIAIREPILLPLRKGFRKVFALHERRIGVTENIFTLKEWKKICNDNGFKLKVKTKPLNNPLIKPFAEQLLFISPFRGNDYKNRFSNFTVRAMNRLFMQHITSYKHKVFKTEKDWQMYYFQIKPFPSR